LYLDYNCKGKLLKNNNSILKIMPDSYEEIKEELESI